MKRITCTLHEVLQKFIYLSRLILLTMSNFSDKYLKKITTHIYSTIIFFSKIMPLYNKVNNCYRTGHSTNDIMAHAHRLLGT